jgi:hypothetical protein
MTITSDGQVEDAPHRHGAAEHLAEGLVARERDVVGVLQRAEDDAGLAELDLRAGREVGG